MLKQKAVYWAFSTYDNYGRPAWSDAVEIDCRWEDVHEEFMAADGSALISSAKVYVDRDIQEGSLLLLSELDSSIDTDNPRDNVGAREVKRFEKLPNLKNTEYLRTCMMV